MSSYVRIECNRCSTTLVIEEDDQLAIAEVGDVCERFCVACHEVTGCEVLPGAPPSSPPSRAARSKR